MTSLRLLKSASGLRRDDEKKSSCPATTTQNRQAKPPTYPLVATTGGTPLARIAGPSTANCPSKHSDTAPTGT